MKIGRAPKRFGGPNDGFRRSGGFAKRGAKDLQREEAVLKNAPQSGGVKIFLDDERPCPEGWTLARSPAEFHQLLESIGDDRIEGIALDWHLGCGISTGEDVAKRLVERMCERPAQFSRLAVVHLHSSDRDAALRMERIMSEPLIEGDMNIPFYDIVTGLPGARRGAHTYY